MRWEDEPYVKLYIRDTPEFLAMSWQARCLFHELLRKVDRAGMLKVGKLGAQGIAVAVRAPLAEIEPAVNELVQEQRLVWNPVAGYYVIPNHIEAQTTPQSDASRKRREREVARARGAEGAELPAGEPTPVAPDAVTSGHEASPLEENRREERNESRTRACPPAGAGARASARSRAVLTPIDREQPLSPEGQGYAQSLGLAEFDHVYRDFVHYNVAEGKVAADWEAMWRRWCHRELRIQRRDRDRSRGRAAPMQRDEPGAPRGWTMPEVSYAKGGSGS